MSLDQGQQTTKTGTLTTFILNLITFSSQHNILLHLSWPLCSRENTESVYCISSKWTVDKSEKKRKGGEGLKVFLLPRLFDQLRKSRTDKGKGEIQSYVLRIPSSSIPCKIQKLSWRLWANKVPGARPRQSWKATWMNDMKKIPFWKVFRRFAILGCFIGLLRQRKL